MRPARFRASLLRRAWDQASRSFTSSYQQVVSPRPCTLQSACRSSRRLFSSGASGPAVQEIQQQHKALHRSSYFWRRTDSFYRPILVAAAAVGCLGGALMYVVLADASGGPEVRVVKKKVVVLGSGWGGMSFLKDIKTELYDVEMVSPRNYFVFTPLIPSVTIGTVEARSIAEPIRRMCRNRKKAAKFYEAECVEIDANNKRLLCRDVTDVKPKGKEEFIVDYDYLVIAVGALSNTFGVPGVEKHCMFLKELEDATKIRKTIVDCFETASLPHLTDEERKKMLSFVVVGGGPTGVEFAAELHDLVYDDMIKLYPLLADHVSLTVVEAVDHILNTFDARIQNFAEQKFQRDGLKLMMNCQVKEVKDGEIVYIDKKANNKEVSLPFGVAVWSTGLGTRPIVRDFMQQIGQGDRKVLVTDEWLRVKGCESAYAMGDCATVEQRKLMEDVNILFLLGDEDKSGTLTVEEFTKMMELIRKRYPQVDTFMKKKHLRHVSDLIRVAEKKEAAGQKSDKLEVDFEAFKKMMVQIDAQMTRFPATAQVAAQQGAYLARCFNRYPYEFKSAEGPVRIRGEGHHRFKPFRYKHLGQFAPLGGEQTAAELPGDWISIGRSTQWLWYSVYASKQVSWRTRMLVLYDWTKRLFFGRDSSRL